LLGFLPNPVMYLAGELRGETAVKRQTSEERKGVIVSESDRENKAPFGVDAPTAIPNTPGWPSRQDTVLEGDGGPAPSLIGREGRYLERYNGTGDKRVRKGKGKDQNIENTTIYAWLTTATLDTQARKVFAGHRVV